MKPKRFHGVNEHNIRTHSGTLGLQSANKSRAQKVLLRLQEEGNGFNTTDIIGAVEHETIQLQSLSLYF